MLTSDHILATYHTFCLSCGILARRQGKGDAVTLDSVSQTRRFHHEATTEKRSCRKLDPDSAKSLGLTPVARSADGGRKHGGTEFSERPGYRDPLPRALVDDFGHSPGSTFHYPHSTVRVPRSARGFFPGAFQNMGRSAAHGRA